MNASVTPALFSVIFIIAIGFGVAKMRWVRQSAIHDLSNLVFYVLTPALLFRTMMGVKVSELDYATIGVYFLAVVVVFIGTLLVSGLTTLAAARALAHTFSNTVMIGIPLVSLVFGEEGLISLFTLISIHALVLMTGGTIVFELAVARQIGRDGGGRNIWRTLAVAIRNSMLHPIPIPIIAGVIYAQTGLGLPDMVDKPLQLMGQALGPMSLLLVGVTLAYSKLKGNLLPALRIAAVKTMVHPLVFMLCAWLCGLKGIPMATMAMVAALPVGANVFLFTQRYKVAEDEVSASIAFSTLLAFVSLPIVLFMLHRWA